MYALLTSQGRLQCKQSQHWPASDSGCDARRYGRERQSDGTTRRLEIPTTKSSYHHGDLRATLIATAMGMLERGEPFSIRAVAREAGVSPTAPYRHFPERDALESALAAQGLRDLRADLTRDRELPTTAEELADLGVAYVDFALRRPALFRLMFGNECDHESEERVQAAAAVHELLANAITGVFPRSDPIDLALGGWGFVHGMAYLYLDRKLNAPSRDDVLTQVRASFLAILNAQTQR